MNTITLHNLNPKLLFSYVGFILAFLGGIFSSYVAEQSIMLIVGVALIVYMNSKISNDLHDSLNFAIPAICIFFAANSLIPKLNDYDITHFIFSLTFSYLLIMLSFYLSKFNSKLNQTLLTKKYKFIVAGLVFPLIFLSFLNDSTLKDILFFNIVLLMAYPATLLLKSQNYNSIYNSAMLNFFSIILFTLTMNILK